MSLPIEARVQAVLVRLRRARAAFDGTDQPVALGGGRRSEPSEQFRLAQDELHAAKQARNRLLVELVGDSETVPVEVIERLEMGRRDAASIIRVVRTGPRLLRENLLGEESHG